MYQIPECRKRLGRLVIASVSLVAFLALFAATGCAGHMKQPFGPDRLIPPDNSRSTFTPKASAEDKARLMETARALSCTHPLGCTCFLDGFQASCAFVFSCIDAGFCECVSGCRNIG
jgi:hypothetical protein